MDHYTIFISDLHLSNNLPKTTELFLKFTEEMTSKVDALYILGDLFQFWIGDDDSSICNEKIKAILRKVSSKIPVYIMPGNRDFLLGKTFARESGCALIADPYEINLYGKRTLLTHGDLLCSQDSRYRIFRSIIRIPYGVKMFLKLPLSFRSWFAINIQKFSNKVKVAKNQKVLATQLEVSKNLLRTFNSEQLIHGHIHIQEAEEFEVGTSQVRRLSLGEWNNQGSILIYYSNNDFEFKILS